MAKKIDYYLICEATKNKFDWLRYVGTLEQCLAHITEMQDVKGNLYLEQTKVG